MQSIFFNYWLLAPFLIWVFFWKGLALWKTARRGEKGWFIALLVINTVGILEILYIFIISKKEITEIQSRAESNDFPKKKIV